MSRPIPTFLPSTGQSATDIEDIIEIGKINHEPLSSPPALYDPKYNPASTGGHLLPVVIVSILISCFMVALRLISTHKNGRTSSRLLMYLEDWLILFGLILVLGLAGFSFAGIYEWQWGWKTTDVHFSNLAFNYKAFYIWYILNLWASCIVRAALILTVRRLYSPMKTRMIAVCDVFLCLKVVFAVGGTLGYTFSCGRNLDIMDIYKFTKYCNGYIFVVAMCTVAVFIDLAIIALPMPLISMLRNVPRRKRFEIGVIFSLGLLAVGASCARLVEMIQFMRPIDKNYNCTYIALACLLELSLALCTSCIPSARVFFFRIYSPDSLFSIKTYIQRRPSVHQYAARLCRFSRKGSSGTANTDYSCDDEEKVDPLDSKDLASPPAAILARDRPLSGGIFDPRADDGRPGCSKSDSQLHPSSRDGKGLAYPSAKVWIACEEDDIDGDDIEELEVFKLPVPSDGFFPYATPLSPRPTTRSSY